MNTEAAGTEPAISLRRATADDAPAIGRVFDAAARDGWGFLGEVVGQSLFSPADWDGLVAAHAPPNAMLVAVDVDDAVIGYCAVRVQQGELFLLFVHPTYAGRGVGRMLLEAAHDILRAAGHIEVFLYTEERNVRARKVYGAAGYRPDGTIRESDMRGIPTRDLRLVKAL